MNSIENGLFFTPCASQKIFVHSLSLHNFNLLIFWLGFVRRSVSKETQQVRTRREEKKEVTNNNIAVL